MRNLLFAMVMFTSPAIAADIYVPPAEVQFDAPYDWSGPFAGIYGGGGAIVNEITLGGANLDGVGGEGVFGGAFAGYDFQVGRFVLGLQGEIGISDIRTTASVPGFALESSSDWDWSISARAGVPFQRALLYGIAGYTWTEYEVEITSGGGTATFTEEYDGWHVGAGVDVAVTDRVFAGVEYRYTELSGEDWSVSGLDVEPSSHTGRLRVGFRF